MAGTTCSNLNSNRFDSSDAGNEISNIQINYKLNSNNDEAPLSTSK